MQSSWRLICAFVAGVVAAVCTIAVAVQPLPDANLFEEAPRSGIWVASRIDMDPSAAPGARKPSAPESLGKSAATLDPR